ncbi:MAG TPA: hypothetical protein VGF36_05240 [Rhodopila sp.]
MNGWMLIRRLRGPAFLLMFGVTALLHEWHILSFGQSWPLYLVLAGVLALAERAAFTGPDPAQIPQQYPPYAGSYPPQPPPSGWQTPPPPPGTGIVPAPPSDIERTEGGR